MAQDSSREYRKMLEEMIRVLDGGAQLDKVAISELKVAQKSLMHCQNKEKRKRTDIDGTAIRVNAATAIWKDVMYRYTLPATKDAFQRDFTMDGMKGYQKFLKEITSCAVASLDREQNISQEEKDKIKVDLMKTLGWLENIALNMAVNLWDYLVQHFEEPEKILGHPAGFTYKRELLAGWSTELRVAKTEANVKYGNKVVVGDVTIRGAKGGVRPSRCVPEVRSIHFVKPEQIKNLKRIGKGVQGEVWTCHILGCPLIQENVILVAKRFKEGNKQSRRADALQEVLMGGVNHRGIVGALAMTIDDPPKLVYDYYNGGDLYSFMEKCDAHSKDNGKGKSKYDFDTKFICQKKIFLENRLGIALALLETVAYFHSVGRVHCDMHFGNILLHFDYDGEVASKVYVGLCDFGMSKSLAQCQEPKMRLGPVAARDVKAYLKAHPQLAPETVGPEPEPFSKATDVYALGNIFDSLLRENWDGMSKYNRYLHAGWSAKDNGARLDAMITTMMDNNAKKREDCLFWSLRMVQAFPNCKLLRQNSPYLRD